LGRNFIARSEELSPRAIVDHVGIIPMSGHSMPSA